MINLNDKILSETTPDQLWLLCHLAKYMGKDMTCFPSNRALCETTGWKKTKVKDVKQQCVNAGLISVEERHNDIGQQSSLYFFKTDLISIFVNLKGKGGEVTPVATTTPPGRHDDPPPVADATPEVLTIEPNNKRAVDFSIFWDAYGFKQGSKKDAERKWNSLSPTVQAEILRVLPAYLHATTTSDAGRVGGRFIPMRKYPLSFLNGRVWENYTDIAPNGSAPAADTLPDDLRPLYQNYLTWAKQHYPGAAAKGIHLTPSQFQAFKTTIYVAGVRAMGPAAEMKRFELAHETMSVDGPQAREYRDVFEYHCKLIAEHAKARTV